MRRLLNTVRLPKCQSKAGLLETALGERNEEFLDIQEKLAREHFSHAQCQEQVEELRQAFSEHAGEVLELEEKLARECRCHRECQNQVEELRQAFNEHDATIALRNAEISQLQALVSAEQKQRTQLEVEVGELHEIVERQRGTLTMRDAELDALRHSQIEERRVLIEQTKEMDNLRSALLGKQSTPTLREKGNHVLQSALTARAPLDSSGQEEQVHSLQSASSPVQDDSLELPGGSSRGRIQCFEDLEQRLRSEGSQGPCTPVSKGRVDNELRCDDKFLASKAVMLEHSPAHMPRSQVGAICRSSALAKRRARKDSSLRASSCSAAPGRSQDDLQDLRTQQALRQCSRRLDPESTTLHAALPDEMMAPFAKEKEHGVLTQAVDERLDGRDLQLAREDTAQAPSTFVLPRTGRDLQLASEDTAQAPSTFALPRTGSASSCEMPSRAPLVHRLAIAEIEQMTFDFKTCLGAGSFGQVFSGRGDRILLPKTSCSGSVAVKVPCSGTIDAGAQFVREMQVAEFGDPNLMPLLAVCVDICALVYPRAECSLEDRLRSIGEPGPSAGVAILLGAVRGLLALHHRDCLHRDVKSSNILIFPERPGEQGPVARLGDFGAVWRAHDTSTPASATLIGTAAYLDPEALASGQCSFSSDIFSLGVVMLEVLLRRSVTELQPDPRPLWRQLNEALALESKATSIAAAVAFVCGAGASESWNAQALEALTMLIVDATQESVTQRRMVNRPQVAVILERLEAVGDLQMREPSAAASMLAPVFHADCIPSTAAGFFGASDHGATMEVTAEIPEASHVPAALDSYLRECTICFEQSIDTRLQPCFHALTCQTCAKLFVDRECPLCRSTITSFEVGAFESTFSPGE